MVWPCYECVHEFIPRIFIMSCDKKSIKYMHVDGYRSRSRIRKRIDCAKDVMGKTGMSTEMTADREEWRKKSFCTD